MNKKAQGQIPAIKTIFILFLLAVILITWAITFMEARNIQIDERKTKTQLVINRLIDSGCFSEKIGKIEKSLLSQENVDICLKGLNETTITRISLKTENDFKFSHIAFGKDEEFRAKASLCTIKNSMLCTQMKYPVYFYDESKKPHLGILTIQILTT